MNTPKAARCFSWLGNKKTMAGAIADGAGAAFADSLMPAQKKLLQICPCSISTSRPK